MSPKLGRSYTMGTVTMYTYRLTYISSNNDDILAITLYITIYLVPQSKLRACIKVDIIQYKQDRI